MAEFNPDRLEFDKIMKDTKEGGPREGGRFLASLFVESLGLEEFKQMAQEGGDMPAPVSQWAEAANLQKAELKQVRNGFRSRISELTDSLERSKNWEGFGGLSEAQRWLEIREATVEPTASPRV